MLQMKRLDVVISTLHVFVLLCPHSNFCNAVYVMQVDAEHAAYYCSDTAEQMW